MVSQILFSGPHTSPEVRFPGSWAVAGRGSAPVGSMLTVLDASFLPPMPPRYAYLPCHAPFQSTWKTKAGRQAGGPNAACLHACSGSGGWESCASTAALAPVTPSVSPQGTPLVLGSLEN